ncbi:uncharacterized protein [Mytilus edulis]|uniref:uncharacterized protein n=1 Tax=Mytilus edulis TaxID=6550 RepID=UPI0039F123BC
MKKKVGNMDIVRTLIILLSLSFVCAASSSIGSEFESSLSCSKFHFEEKVLEKLVRLEHKMQILEEKMDAREKLNTAKLDEINNIMNAREKLNTAKLDEISNIKKQTETFVQSVQDAQIRDQTRFNKSYQEIVEHFQTQVDNETEIYGDHMNALLGSLSSKMEVFTEAEKKRESVTEFMKRSFDREQEKFNSSYDQIVENFKVTSGKTLQELIVNQQKGYEEMVKKRDPVAFSAYRTSSQSVPANTKVKFDQVWTNVGNGYDSKTGVFTVPRTGLYHITAVILTPSGTNFYPRLYHNKVHVSGSYLTSHGYQTGTFDVVLGLQKGDQVYIAGHSSTFTIYSDSFAHVTFSGHSIA